MGRIPASCVCAFSLLAMIIGAILLDLDTNWKCQPKLFGYSNSTEQGHNCLNYTLRRACVRNDLCRVETQGSAAIPGTLLIFSGVVGCFISLVLALFNQKNE